MDKDLREILELHRLDCLDLDKKTNMCMKKNKICTNWCDHMDYWRNESKKYMMKFKIKLL